jgi:hypothetical protein
MRYLEATALKILALVGIEEAGLTGWVFLVLGAIVVAGLVGRLWAWHRSRNDQG